MQQEARHTLGLALTARVGGGIALTLGIRR